MLIKNRAYFVQTVDEIKGVTYIHLIICISLTHFSLEIFG